MDETWINKNLVPTHFGSDGKLDVEPTPLPSKGQKWIIIGAGGLMGWIPQSVVFWKGTISSEDYHSEMNAAVFQDWLKTKLLPNVPSNAVIVVDRASYHLGLHDSARPITSAMSRANMIDWVVSHNIKDSEGNPYTADRFDTEDQIVINVNNGNTRTRKGWTKTDIYKLGMQHKPKPVYVAQHIIDNFNTENNSDIKLLVLPVAHPILNPIEMMWGQMKQYVREYNYGESMDNVKRLALEKIGLQQPEHWEKAFRHTMKYIWAQQEADNIVCESSTNILEEDSVEEIDESDEESSDESENDDFLPSSSSSDHNFDTNENEPVAKNLQGTPSSSIVDVFEWVFGK